MITLLSLPFRELRYGLRHYRRVHRRINRDEQVANELWRKHRRREYLLALGLAARSGGLSAADVADAFETTVEKLAHHPSRPHVPPFTP